MSYRYNSPADLLEVIKQNYIHIAASPAIQLTHARDHMFDMRRRVDNQAWDLVATISHAEAFRMVPESATHTQILGWLDEAIAFARSHMEANP